MNKQRTFVYSHSIGLYAQQGGPGFENPVDLALGRDDVLYVVNRSGDDLSRGGQRNKRVTICTVAEEYIGDFGIGGDGDGDLMWPCSIAIDRDEKVYVSDSALHRISIFDSRGTYLAKWGTEGESDGQFNRPAGIAFDRDDNLLVVDALNNRVQKYTKDGAFLHQWGRGGNGEGELNVPWGVTLDQEGNVYVADWRNDRIQKFDGDGNFLATWGSPGTGDGEFHRPAGVAVDDEGNVYVADWGNERVQVLSPDGSFLDKIRGESGLSKWGEHYFVSNQDELEEREKSELEPALDMLPSESLWDQSANIEKLFWGPTSIRIDAQGRIFVVDSHRHRIQIYRKESR